MKRLKLKTPNLGIKTRTSIDVRSDAAYWVCVAGLRNPTVRGWGHIPRHEQEEFGQLLDRLAASGVERRRGVWIALRSPDLEHERIELPSLTHRQAGEVGKRRAAELANQLPMESTCGFSRGSDADPRPLWLCAAPLGLAQISEERWRDGGFPVAHLASHHFALGHLAQLLPPNPPGSLTLFVDLDESCGTCTAADDLGWLFSRQIPLKFSGEKRVSGEFDEEELEPREESFSQAERLTTELERTVRYIQSVLSLGSVARIVLSGEGGNVGEVREIAAVLTANLEIETLLIGDAITEGAAAGIPPGAAVALGLALDPEPQGSNLLPEPSKQALRTRALRRYLLLGLAGEIFACALVTLIFSNGLDSIKAQIARLEGEWSASVALRMHASEGKRARARARGLMTALETIDRSGPSFASSLELLERITPEQVVLDRYTAGIQEGHWKATFVADGFADSVSEAAVSVSELVRRLDESPLFGIDRVERQAAAMRPGQLVEGKRVRFRIDTRIAPTDSSGQLDVQPEPGAAQRG